jgi:uncharacterized RDD family membrane protein YckC
VSDAPLNPYEPPQMADGALEEEGSAGESHEDVIPVLAGTASIYRLAAAILDEGVATLLFFVTAMPLTTVLKAAGLPFIAAAGVWLTYFFLTEWLLAATPGKLLLRLRVCTESGDRCTAQHIAVRTLWRILEVNPLICGLFPAGIAVNCTARHQRLGDIMAGTLVVRKSQLPRD